MSPRSCAESWRRRSWKHELVAIGAATDPYQPAEGRYRLTRACLEVLAEAHNPFSIISRGPLMVRDIDVLQDASRRAGVSVTFSIPTLDDRVWRTTEPGTAHPRQPPSGGLDARQGRDRRQRRHRAGAARTVRLRWPRSTGGAGGAGCRAQNVWTRVLYLPPGTREHFLEQLGRDWPDHVPEYEELYRGRAYPPRIRMRESEAIVRERRAAAASARHSRSAHRCPKTGDLRSPDRRPLPVVAQAQLGALM